MESADSGRYFWQNDRVRLRALTEADWKMDYDNRFDSEARLLLEYEIELPPTERQSRESAAAYAGFDTSRGRVMFAVETLDGRAVGGINLNSIDERNGTFSVGLQIDRNCRGKGYGTAAMRLLLGYAFYERRLHKFCGSTLENNAASQAMLLGLGCSREGVRRETVYAHGRYYDEILFGLTREEYDRRDAGQ